MSELNIREKWNYTQRPEVERRYLAAEMANALEVTLPTFYSLAKKLDLDFIKIADKRGRYIMYFDHVALKLCQEELERRENEKKAQSKAVQRSTTASKEEHPLVTDERCLNFNYWPEIVPACFAEVI